MKRLSACGAALVALSMAAVVGADPVADPIQESCDPPPGTPGIGIECPEGQRCCSFTVYTPPWYPPNGTWYAACCDKDKRCEIEHCTNPEYWGVICTVWVPPEGS